MKGIVWTGTHTVELQELEKPVPGRDEVLIRVVSAGVCVTDLHIIEGLFKYCEPPAILGHEIAGIVEETGTEVTSFKQGDRVVVETMVNCGECYHCRTGNKNLCDRGGDIGYPPYQGGYAQYIRVPARCLYRIPDTVSFDEAAIVEAVMCPIGAIYRLGMRFGETVLIQGAGVAGLAFVQGAKLYNAGKIIITDNNRSRLEQALKFGADVAVDPSKEDLGVKVMSETENQGADISIDAVGAAVTVDNAVALARKNGRIILYGIPQHDASIGFPVTEIILKQLSVHGASGNPHVWEPLLQMTAKGLVNLKDMVTHVLPMTRFDEALRLVRERPDGMIKAVIHPWE